MMQKVLGPVWPQITICDLAKVWRRFGPCDIKQYKFFVQTPTKPQLKITNYRQPNGALHIKQTSTFDMILIADILTKPFGRIKIAGAFKQLHLGNVRV
jgi:hypothetical protein